MSTISSYPIKLYKQINIKSMKTLTIIIGLFPMLFLSQELINENFDSYPVGPVSTTLNDEVYPGENGYYVFAGANNSTNVNENTAQFVEYNGGKALQLIGPNGTDGIITVYNDYLLLGWSNRDPNNNIIITSFDLIQNTANNGQHLVGVYMENSDNFVINRLVGASFDTRDEEIYMDAYYDEGNGPSSYYFSLEPSLPFNPEQIYHVDMSFNFETGKTKMFVNGSQKIIDGAGAGIEPRYLTYFIGSYGNNSNSDVFLIDNVIVTATNQPLGTEDLEYAQKDLSTIYPNPVGESFQIHLAESFESSQTTITISDMSGKRITSFPYSETMKVNNLNSGVYIVTISDGEHSENQKLIKK